MQKPSSSSAGTRTCTVQPVPIALQPNVPIDRCNAALKAIATCMVQKSIKGPLSLYAPNSLHTKHTNTLIPPSCKTYRPIWTDPLAPQKFAAHQCDAVAAYSQRLRIVLTPVSRKRCGQSVHGPQSASQMGSGTSCRNASTTVSSMSLTSSSMLMGRLLLLLLHLRSTIRQSFVLMKHDPHVLGKLRSAH